MRLSLPWTMSGTIGLGLLALPLGVLVMPRSTAQAPAALPAWVVPWPSTPYRTAIREAGYWRGLAIQLAADEQAEAHEALQDWDPAARQNSVRQIRRFLAADDRGYLKRALAALRTAERLASTPADKSRAERCRQFWERDAHPASRSA